MSDDVELIERYVYAARKIESPTDNYRRRIDRASNLDIIERCWVVTEDGISKLDWRPIPVVDQEGNPCT